MLAFFTSLFSSGILGSLFGGISAGWQLWVNKKHEREMAKLSNEKDKEKYKYNLEVAKVEAASAEKRAEIDAQIRAQESADKVNVVDIQASAASLQAAMANDKATYVDTSRLGKLGNTFMAIVDLWRGIVRPAITSWSMFLLTYMLWQVMPLIPALPEDEKTQIIFLVLNLATFVITKAIVYWFGDRGKEIATLIFGKKK